MEFPGSLGDRWLAAVHTLAYTNKVKLTMQELSLVYCQLTVWELKEPDKLTLIPLLNHYRSFRQIYTIGEIDFPNPKRLYSP